MSSKTALYTDEAKYIKQSYECTCVCGKRNRTTNCSHCGVSFSFHTKLYMKEEGSNKIIH